MGKMNREDAIEYLLDKDKICLENGRFREAEEEEIAKVIKDGYIYDDGMEREDAIDYLQSKNKIRKPEEVEYDEGEEEKIESVMKRGKIFGDPLAEFF